MTPEEILKIEFFNSSNVPLDDDEWFTKCWMILDPSPSKTRILKAMEIFAKQKSIAFAQWIVKERWEISTVEPGKYFNMKHDERLTLSSLYELWEEETKK